MVLIAGTGILAGFFMFILIAGFFGYIGLAGVMAYKAESDFIETNKKQIAQKYLDGVKALRATQLTKHNEDEIEF